jgi:type I restriction enzyme S subunit
METKETRIGDCILCNPAVKLTKGKIYPVIDIDKITVGKKFVTNRDVIVYDGQGGAKFENGDTLMARITPCLENGKMAKAKIEGQGLGSTELFVFRGKDGVTDNDYVYYFLKQQYIRNLAANSMTGASGRQRADLKFIKKIKLNLPVLDYQRRIASILSAYDNLIENNNKRIRLLEQMAENLYKEWFVRFRFPGHEKAEFVSSKLGKIPSSFSVTNMGDVFEEYIGGGWGNDEVSEEFPISASVIRGADFPSVWHYDVSTCPKRFHKKSNYKSRQLHDGDIVMEISGGTSEQPVGRTVLVTQDLIDHFEGGRVICASFCKMISLNKEKISPYFFYFWMHYLYDTRIIDRFQLQSTGIINFKFEPFLKKGIVMLPSKDVMLSFDKHIIPLFKEINQLAIQNDKLSRQRDLLLPRLMSGKLEVKL